MITAVETYKQYIVAENFYKLPHFVDLKQLNRC